MAVELGVRDGGGVGGGKGWSIGVPYGRCRFRGGWSAGALVSGEEIGGGSNTDEEERGAKNEGFTRLVTWLPLLIGSGVPWMVFEVGKDERGREGICGTSGEGITTLGGWEVNGMVGEGWYGCLEFATLEAVLPIFMAVCKNSIQNHLGMLKKKIMVKVQKI